MEGKAPSALRVGLVLSLVSSLQMFHQSILSGFSLKGLDRTQIAFASASFPLGKVVSTLWLLLCSSSADVAHSLRTSARLLVLGGCISAIPFSPFLSIGRFLTGAGAGIGFVCAPLFLSSVIPFSHRPGQFFILGVSFAASTLMANLLAFTPFSELGLVLFSSAFAIISGLLYIVLEPSSRALPPSPSLPPEDEHLSARPVALSNALMLLNVTCGVPVFLGYAPLIFHECFNLDRNTALILSLIFPATQVLLLSILHFFPSLLGRASLVVGGYGVSVAVLFTLAVTALYPYLPPQEKSVALSFWLFVLTLVTSVPCNTALCVIAEQFPCGTEEQLGAASLARTLMWLLSAISTLSFLPMVGWMGVGWTLLPYAFSSLVLLGLVVLWMPRNADNGGVPF